jgi:hypothetical protein
MYQRIERPLKPREASSLNAHIGRARRDGRFAAQLVTVSQLGLFMFVGAVVLGWFAGRSLVESALFASLITLAMAPIVILGNRRKQNRAIQGYRSILEANRVVVHVVRSQSCIKFAEHEDEGDLWMFQLSADEVLVLKGQEYYETRRFPALNFEIIAMGDLPIQLRTQSAKISPQETISSSGSDLLPSIEGGIIVMKGHIDHADRAFESLRRKV